jgi:hypothetical protein
MKILLNQHLMHKVRRFKGYYSSCIGKNNENIYSSGGDTMEKRKIG